MGHRKRTYRHGKVIRSLLVMAVIAVNPFQTRAEPAAKSWPLASFYFDFNRLSDSKPEQVKELMELGYAGMVYNLVNQAQLNNYDQYLDAVNGTGFRMFAAYVPLTLREDNAANYAHLEKVICRLARVDASLWVIVQKTEQDRTAVLAALNRIANIAAEAGVEFVIYPHDRTTIESAEEALGYIQELGRNDIYVSLHLCHEIRAGNGDRLNEVAANIKPWLRLPSISGSDEAYEGAAKGDWSRNIKPLGDGDYDASKLLKALQSVGYEGPVILHTFGLQKVRATHHTDSIKVYCEMLEQLNGGFKGAEPPLKIYQFEPDQVPRIDGQTDDWAMVPESYVVGSDRMKDTVRGTESDPATLDVRVKVGWVKGLNRLYFLYEAYDDYWDFAMPGMHNDILEVMVDGDASGGPITAAVDPKIKHGSWEGYLMQGVQAQNYHIFTPSAGKNWAMVWGCQPWALELPWSNAAQRYDFGHGESGWYTLEFWITPFDHAPINGPENAVVSELEEGAEIGLSWVVLDYDDENAGKNGFRSFNNLSDDTLVHSDAGLLRRFMLMPIENQELEARWSFFFPDRAERKVCFNDESRGDVQRWYWDFGDGCSSTNQNPEHIYAEGGLHYVISLQVENEAGSNTFSRVWEVCLP